MEAWLGAHAIKAIARPAWAEGRGAPDSESPESSPESGADDAPKSQSGRRSRNAEALRQHLKELAELLGPRDLDTIVGFGGVPEGAARRARVRAPPRAHDAGARRRRAPRRRPKRGRRTGEEDGRRR